MWRTMIFRCDWPSVRAARMNCCSRSDRGHAADHARHACPADEAQDDDDHRVDLRGTHARRKRGAQRNDQIKRGDGHDKFAQAHDDGVGRAGEITGDAANHHAKGERQQNADDPDGKRDLRTIKQARENVAAKLVGAEKIDGMVVVHCRTGGWKRESGRAVCICRRGQKNGAAWRHPEPGDKRNHRTIVHSAGTTKVKILEPGPDGRVEKTLVVQALIVVRRDEAGENRHEIKERSEPRRQSARFCGRLSRRQNNCHGERGEFRFGDGAGRGGFHFI